MEPVFCNRGIHWTGSCTCWTGKTQYTYSSCFENIYILIYQSNGFNDGKILFIEPLNLMFGFYALNTFVKGISTSFLRSMYTSVGQICEKYHTPANTF